MRATLLSFRSTADGTEIFTYADEVRLIRYPIALGSGTPTAPNNGVRRGFASMDAKDFQSGARLERYRPTM